MAGAGGMGTVNEVEPEIGQTRECSDKPALDRCPKDTVGFIFLIDPLALLKACSGRTGTVFT
jgi:hypothetical protein